MVKLVIGDELIGGERRSGVEAMEVMVICGVDGDEYIPEITLLG